MTLNIGHICPGSWWRQFFIVSQYEVLSKTLHLSYFKIKREYLEIRFVNISICYYIVNYLCAWKGATIMKRRMNHFNNGTFGCGIVGRTVTSDTREPGFESRHRQLLLNVYLLWTVCWKDVNKEKETKNGQF